MPTNTEHHKTMIVPALFVYMIYLCNQGWFIAFAGLSTAVLVLDQLGMNVPETMRCRNARTPVYTHVGRERK